MSYAVSRYLSSRRRFVTKVLEESDLVRVDPDSDVPGQRPDEIVETEKKFFVDGTDGDDIGHAPVADPDLEDPKRGLYALETADIFNLLCIPPFKREGERAARRDQGGSQAQ